MRRRTLLALLGSGILLFGCQPAAEKNKKSGPAADGGDKPLVAFVSNNAFQFWTFAEKGAEKAAAEFNVQLAFKKPAQGTAQVQREIIEDLINRGCKGVAVSPEDPKNTVSFYKTVAKQMVLIATDNDIPAESGRKCYIGTHNYRAGRGAGELVKKAFPKGAKIAIFVGKIDSPNAVERRQGVLDVLAGKDQKDLGDITDRAAVDLPLGNGYELLATRIDQSNEANCQAMAEDLLNKTPEVDCLIGLWAYNPPALLRAARSSKNAKKPLIVAFDENDETLAGVRSGAIVGTIVQNPYEFGYQSIKILSSLIKGNDDILKTWPGIETGNLIFVPHRVITKDNVEAFAADVKKILSQ